MQVIAEFPITITNFTPLYGNIFIMGNKVSFDLFLSLLSLSSNGNNTANGSVAETEPSAIR